MNFYHTNHLIHVADLSVSQIKNGKQLPQPTLVFAVLPELADLPVRPSTAYNAAAIASSRSGAAVGTPEFQA